MSDDKYHWRSDLGWVRRIDVLASESAWERLVTFIQRLLTDLDAANARADAYEAEASRLMDKSLNLGDEVTRLQARTKELEGERD